jgi:hypothetical protein
MKPAQHKYEGFAFGFQRIELLRISETSYIYVMAAMASETFS